MARPIIQVLVPPPVAPPRGAEWAATVAVSIARGAASLWHQISQASTRASRRPASYVSEDVPWKP